MLSLGAGLEEERLVSYLTSEALVAFRGVHNNDDSLLQQKRAWSLGVVAIDDIGLFFLF